MAYWGSSEEVKLLAPLLNRFEKEHPGVFIQRVHIPQQYVQKLHFMAASRLLPDVMMVNSWVLPTYAQSGQLRPLTVTPEDFYPQATRALSWQGRFWAYPRDVSNLVVYANVDLLKQHGLPVPSPRWTLTDLHHFSQVLKPIWTISAQDTPPLFWLPWVWAYGGELWGKQCVLPESSLPGLKAFSQLRQLDSTGYSMAPTVSQAGATPMAQWFLKQKLAFLVSGRWTVPLLKKQATFRWVTVPLPAGPQGSHTGIDATGYAISAQSQHPQLAEALARFLTRADNLQTLSQSGLIVPARMSVAKTVLANDTAFLTTIASGVATQSSPYWQALSEQMTEQLQPVFNGSAPIRPAVNAIRLYYRQLSQQSASTQCP